MRKNVEIISDDNGIEIIVSYNFETSDQNLNDTEINSVEVVIAGRGVQILPFLSGKQLDHIISKLQYE